MMTDQAATVRWFPAAIYRPLDHEPKPVWGSDKTFESVDKAVTYVMEQLEEVERSTAYIATASFDIGIDDIERMYAARKK